MRTRTVVSIAAVAVLIVLIGSFIASNDDSGDVSFVILHSNDTHCYLGSDGNLGFATLKSLKEEKLSQGDTVFVFDAGDFLQGNVYGTMTEGSASVMIMNEVGYDLGVPGNHDFDFSFSVMMERVSKLNYPLICSNLIYGSTGESIFEEYKILKKNGVTLGCFGLLTPDTESSTKKGNMEDAVVTDPYKAAERMVSILKQKNVDCIVCLGHMGVGDESSVKSDEICNRIPGIDIFIDGHSHTEMENGKVCDGSIELLPSDSVIASTGCYCKRFGIVTVDTEGDIAAKLYRGEAREDFIIDGLVATVHDEVDRKLDTVVGSTTIYLDGKKEHVRAHETNLGDLIADSMRTYTGTDIAMINGGGVRTSLQEGDIKMKDVFNIMPFLNENVTLTVTGDNVYSAMEIVYSHGGEIYAGFLQVSGIVVTYDLSKEAGSRVVSITMDGKEIDRSASYTLTTLDFVATGGDGMDAFVGIPTQVSGYDYEMFADYLGKIGPIDDSKIPGERQVSA